MANPTCETCRFWNSESEYGDCCRRAPKVYAYGRRREPPDTVTVWPSTMRDDFCGEHQPTDGGEA